jgi:ferric-dicitrate binding protein FerR (iron transport regulator)
MPVDVYNNEAMNYTDKYIELITRYFSGEATIDEARELSNWVGADPTNKALFEEYAKTWQQVESRKADDTIDLDQEWQVMQSIIQAGETETTAPNVVTITPVQQSVRWMLRIAAILVIAAVPLYFLYQYASKPGIQSLASGADIIEAILPDGTTVTINRNSTLEYPEQFKGKNRNVQLTGEAFFNVAHDKDKPFIINANGLRVKVLGTTFNMNTRKQNNEMEVILVDGSVEVYYQDRETDKLVLAPGERAIVNTSNQDISVVRNEDPNFMAWKTRLIIFLDQPLGEVISILNNVYGSNISLQSDSLENYRLTATFDKQSLESVLQVITTTLDLNMQSLPSGIVLSIRE